MLVWPEVELGIHFLLDDFQYEAPDGRLRNPMDRGPTKSRGDSEGTPNIIVCSSEPFWNLNQLARWRRWWKEETQGGNLPFTVRDPQFDGVYLLTDGDAQLLVDEALFEFAQGSAPVLAPDTDQNIDPLAPLFVEPSLPIIVESFWLVMFGELKPVERALSGNLYRVSFNLERLDG